MDYLKQLQEMASEIETKEPYQGYFYKVSDVITILVVGLLCSLQTAHEIYQWSYASKLGSDFEMGFAKASTLITDTSINLENLQEDLISLSSELKVYIRKIDNEYVKADFNFKREVINSTTTYIVDFELGTGDDKGNGKMKISKLADGAYITYKSRTDGTEHGIKITDEGTYYFDVTAKDWLLIGSGGGNHVIIDYLPKQADIDECNADDVVLVYDLTPFTVKFVMVSFLSVLVWLYF